MIKHIGCLFINGIDKVAINLTSVIDLEFCR